jgi:hypothetical protein
MTRVLHVVLWTISAVLGTEGGVLVERHFGWHRSGRASRIRADRAVVLARHAAPGTVALAARSQAEVHRHVLLAAWPSSWAARLLGLVNEAIRATSVRASAQSARTRAAGLSAAVAALVHQGEAKAARC